MSTMSLLDRLPRIVADGIAEAEAILDELAQAPHPVDHELTGDVATPSGALNRLVRGDNLDVMAGLLAGDVHRPALRGGVDLVYADPPFASGADYRAKVAIPGEPPLVVDHLAYRDTWPDGIEGYLAMLVPRLALMRELLSERGTLWLHLDWHVHHYVKVVLDELFGPERLVNEVVWRYGKMSNVRRRFPQNHDVLLVYSRAEGYTFNPVRGADSEYRARFARYLDGNRVRYGRVRDSRDKLVLRRVAKVRERLGRELRDDDTLFDFDTEFKTQDDVFYDISIVKGNAAENQQYDTQKPQKLLARVIEAGSNPGDLVFDPFCGSGTTVAVAERLGRRWVAADAGALAVGVTRRRLVVAGAEAFAIESLAAPHPDWMRVQVERRADCLTARLEGYSSPDAPPGVDPLRLVERWSVGDVGADGVFRPAWQGTVGETATVRSGLPGRPEARVVDVFGEVSASPLP